MPDPGHEWLEEQAEKGEPSGYDIFAEYLRRVDALVAEAKEVERKARVAKRGK